MNRWLCAGGTITVVIIFKNKWFTEYRGTGPWFCLPNEELLYTEKRGGGKKMSVSEKSGP